MMAPPGIQPGQSQNLKAAIASQSGPVNPNTPNPADRKDPRESELLNLNRIRRALERALEPYEGMPQTSASDVLHLFKGVVSRMLAGIDPVQALIVGVQSIVPGPMPGGGPTGMTVPPVPAGPAPPPLPGMLGAGPGSPGPPPG